MGLIVSKELIKQYGGTLDLSSEDKVGSTFAFSFGVRLPDDNQSLPKFLKQTSIRSDGRTSSPQFGTRPPMKRVSDSSELARPMQQILFAQATEPAPGSPRQQPRSSQDDQEGNGPEQSASFGQSVDEDDTEQDGNDDLADIPITLEIADPSCN